MATPAVLIVDDEPELRELLRLTITKLSFEVAEAANVHEAKKKLEEGHFGLCITDLKLPDGDGMSVIEYIEQHCPEVPVAVLSAHGTMELAIQALKRGAFDFLSKPVDLKILRNLVQTALSLEKSPSQKRGAAPYLVGHSPAMKTLRARIEKLARSQAPCICTVPPGR